MSNQPALPDSVDDGFAAVVVAYLQAREEGHTPTPAEWLDCHPEYATELAAFFEDQAQLENLAQPLREVGRAAWSGSSVPQVAEITVAETEPAPVCATGRCYGDYEVLEEIARGGMGVVYKARQKSLNRLVALKVIRAGELASAADVQRFRQEAETIALLDHPQIVPVYEVGEQDGQVFFVMKLLEGERLADRANKAAVSKAEQRSAARLVAMVARAIHHAHQRGVLHRDLKPSNILLDGQGQPHVTDFGLAKRVHADSSLTQSGAVLGTPSYMAPEQARGDKGQITTVTDVYGLGAVLYTLLTGRPPFHGETVLETLEQIQQREPESVRGSNPGINRDLETICLKCLQKEPAQRYTSAEALADDLQHWLEDRPIQARRPTWWLRLRRWSRRHKPLVGAAMVVLLVVTLLLVTLVWTAYKEATRHAALAYAVQAALQDSADWQQRGRLLEALSAARRADGLLAGTDVDTALVQHVQDRLADLMLVDRLQQIRLADSTIDKDGTFDTGARDQLYKQTFRAVDIDIEVKPAEAAARIRTSSVPIELAAVLDDWAWARRTTRGTHDPSWKAPMRVACLVDTDRWRIEVRQAVTAEDWDALRRLADAADPAKLSPETLVVLGAALQKGMDREARAESLLRAAQRQYPDDFWLNKELFDLYSAQGQSLAVAEALRFATAAVAVRPECAGAHANLCSAFYGAHRMDEAMTEAQEAIRLNKNHAGAHCYLGAVLLAKGRLDEGIAECQVSIRLKDSAEAHVNLGNALDHKGQPDGAIAEYRKAIQVNKDFAPAHYNLGVFLEEYGRLDEAGNEYREAIRLKKDFAKAHCGLANVLMMRGSLREAANEYRRGHELGSHRSGWSFPSAEMLHRAEAMARLDAHFPDLLAGRARPRDTAEQMNLAWLCQQSYKRRYAASARWYAAAFAAQPGLAADLRMQHRYNAACAAALAGCGKGKDADKLSSGDRARLRQQARDWLRADLKAYEQALDQHGHRIGSVLALYLQHSLQDDDLASVRNEVALAKLPELERAGWRKLWADVRGLITRTRTQIPAQAPAKR